MTAVLALDLICGGAAGLLLARTSYLLRLRSAARRAITGRVRPIEGALTAPLSGRPCICYDARGGIASADFLIDDGRRTVRVAAAGARFLFDDSSRRAQLEEGDGWPPPEGHCILPSEVVSVIGDLAEEIDCDGTTAHPFREAPTRLVVRSTRKHPALVLRGAPCDLTAEATRSATISLIAAALCLAVAGGIGTLLGF